MKKKKILCKHHINLNYPNPWCDIWISYKSKPGRKKVYLSPCLISSTCRELDDNGILQNHNHPDLYMEGDIDKANLCIYSEKEYIDKKEAERMISHLLKIKGVNINNIKFSWKNPRIFAMPWSF